MKYSRRSFFRLFLARHRTIVTVIATAVGYLALGLFFSTLTGASMWFKLGSLGVFVLSTVLTVFVSATPEFHERVRYAASFLPAIADVLGLDSKARITIHHMYNKRQQTYEQVTDYYPTRIGQGRRFVFTQGITGQAFRTRISQVYSIPAEQSLEVDYQQRWSFTKDEITRLTQDRRSFYAYPIGQDGSYARAVLYMDSADATMFTRAKKAELDDKVRRLFLPTLEELLDIRGPSSPV